MQNRNGKLFIVSAPSGAGKTTLISRVLERFKTLSYSISHTTRPPRGTERDGEDYFFVSAGAFEKKIENNELLEWARVHDHYYGTSREFVQKKLEQGSSLLLDIDVQGAMQIMATDLNPVSIFIMAPSFKELENRLLNRGTDAPDVIQKRLKNAKDEIARKNQYQYTLVNDDLEEAAATLYNIFEKELN